MLPEVPPEVWPEVPPEVLPEVPPEVPPEVSARRLPDVPPEVLPEVPPEVFAGRSAGGVARRSARGVAGRSARRVARRPARGVARRAAEVWPDVPELSAGRRRTGPVDVGADGPHLEGPRADGRPVAFAVQPVPSASGSDVRRSDVATLVLAPPPVTRLGTGHVAVTDFVAALVDELTTRTYSTERT